MHIVQQLTKMVGKNKRNTSLFFTYYSGISIKETKKKNKQWRKITNRQHVMRL